MNFKNECVHIRVQQRNGKKCITTVSGIAEDLNVKKITKYLKNKFNTSGSINKEDNAMQFAGDHRSEIKEFFIEHEIYDEEHIIIHGA